MMAMPSPRPHALASIAALGVLALAAALVAPACTSGTTADCSDAQCGVVSEASSLDQSLSDDSGDDGSDASQGPTPDASSGPDQEAGGPADSGGSDSPGATDAPDDHHDSGSKDAAEGG
jgi:hypothetical protein